MAVPLHYTVDGPDDAPVLVLGPSLGTTGAMWEPQVPLLSTRLRVVRYDHRGHGGSPVPPGPYALADLGEPAGALVPAWVEEASAVGNEVHGVVITLDHFGNLITNIDAGLIERFRQPEVLAGNHRFPMLRTYGETQPGEYLALINSFGVVEIARAEQSAADGLGLGRGAPVLVREASPGAAQLKGRADRL